MNQLVALGVQTPQINTLGSFMQGQQHAQALQKGEQDLRQGEMAMDAQKKAQAEHVLQLVGTASMHALGGNINGAPDPEKFEQGLDMLESQGFDVQGFRGKPQMAPIAAKASMTAFQQLSLAKSDRDFDFAMQKFEADMMQNDRQSGLEQQRLDLQRQGLKQKSALDVPSGYRPGANGSLEAIPGGPSDPNNPLNTRKVTAPLTATDKKAIFSAQDELPVLDNTITALKRALELNPDTSEGVGANQVGKYGSQLPESIRPGTADPTREYLDIMTAEAATQMSAVLKGATTDKELGIFMSIISDVSKPKAVRERALNRMIELAEGRKKVATDRISALQGDIQPGATSAPDTGEITSREAYDALPSGAEFMVGGKRFKKP